MSISNYLSQPHIIKFITQKQHNLTLFAIAVGFLFFLAPDLVEAAEPAKIAPALSSWEVERTMAGPTGAIYVRPDNHFKVIRFGTLAETHHLYIKNRRPDDIYKLDFISSIDVLLTRRNGQQEWYKRSDIQFRTGQGSFKNYMNNQGMEFVVLDPVTGQLQELNIPNFDNIFKITFDPPTEWKGKRAAPLKELSPWEVEQTLAGPMGKIETSRGTFDVLRFGSLLKPHPLYINKRRPEEIVSLEFLPNSDVRLTLGYGKTEMIKKSDIQYRTGQNSYANYMSNIGMQFVVYDYDTGHREENFPNYEGIYRITFQRGPEWMGRPATSFGPAKESIRAPAALASKETNLATNPPEMSISATESAPKTTKPTTKFGIGEKVCKHLAAYSNEYQGYTFVGKPAYKERQGSAVITTFVERVEGSRLQLRVGGIQFRPFEGGGASTSMSQFDYEGSQLTPGLLFWDNASAGWFSCL